MNVVRNEWGTRAKGRSRHVTVEIETTQPATGPEFTLMAELTEVVERYMAGHPDPTSEG